MLWISDRKNRIVRYHHSIMADVAVCSAPIMKCCMVNLFYFLLTDSVKRVSIGEERDSYIVM